MQKINNWIVDHRRNLPINMEEVTILETIQRLGNGHNEIVDKVGEIDTDNKTKVSHKQMNEVYKNINGNHMGSWQGVKSPVMSDPGIQGQVIKNIEDIATLGGETVKVNNKIDTMKRDIYKNNVDLSLLPNYNKNDISVMLNSLTLLENTRYFLNDGNLKSLNLIKIDIPKTCSLEIQGIIECYSSFMEVRMSLKGGSLSLDTIDFKGIIENDKGVHLLRGAECEININRIKGFKKCLLLEPVRKPINNNFDVSDWLQYNKINFFSFSGDIAIDICCTFKDTWINENTFNGGGLGGRVNVYMHKDYVEEIIVSQINNNKFYNLGVQSTEECIKIKDRSGEHNYFYNLRMQEQEWDKSTLNINDKGSLNYYECLCAVAYESIILGDKSEYKGLLQCKVWDNGTSSYPLVGVGAYGNSDRARRMYVNKMKTNVNVDFVYSEYNLYTSSEVVRCSMDTGETGNLRLKNSMFYDSNNFYLTKLGYSNSVINIFTPSNKKVTINDNGLYYVMLANNTDYFEIIKIATGDGLTPS